MGMEYVNTTGRSPFVKSVEVHKYVNIKSRGRIVKSVEAHKYVNISRSMGVKSVEASIFKKKSIDGLETIRKTIN